MTAPLLSVVVPTRDRTDLLLPCLARLEPAFQSLDPAAYEVIVTDDGDTSTTRDAVAGKAGVRWTAGPRRGPAANRNNGARVARGEFLVFIDDDCLPDRDTLRAYAGVTSDGADVYEGRVTVRDGITTPCQTAPLNLEGGALWSCNLAISRAAFEALGGFDERYPLPHMEDVDFRERLRAAGMTVRFVPEASVDHPPRRLPWGWRLARMHRATMLYMVLHPPVQSLPWFLQNQLRARVSRIVRMPKSRDSLIALSSVPFELAAIAWHWRGWKAWARAITGAAAR